MAEKKKLETPIKDYAGGWITEREGTEVPGFLKLAIPIIGLSGAAYLMLYINGDVGNAGRGPLIQALDRVTGDANGLMYVVEALVLFFVVVVARFALAKSKH